MGNGASVEYPSTVLSAKDFPKQLYVEGAGSTIANGEFVLRTDRDEFPLTIIKKSSFSGNVADYSRSVWFSKDNGEDAWMVFLDGNPEQRKWIIFTAKETLYIAPIADQKIMTPRQGRWELGDGGASPAPTVNLRPLPLPFRLSGWKGRYDHLNGEYLPFDNGTELLNGRPIFKHTPMVGTWSHNYICRMCWSHGAWCIDDKTSASKIQQRKQENEAPPNQPPQNKTPQCIAFVNSDVIHPTVMPADVVWKATASGRNMGIDENGFELVEGVSLTTGASARVYVSTAGADVANTLIVRPWFDTVRELQSQAFATNTPPQRQQLFLGDRRLQDDGRVLALHGVVAESIINLVVLKKYDVLDALFDECVTMGSLQPVGSPLASPRTVSMDFGGGVINPVDGRFYLVPRTTTQASRFDPVTNSWETFGNIFPQTKLDNRNCKYIVPVLSSVDNCIYTFPSCLNVVHRILQIDPLPGTAQEVGGDLRPFIDDQKKIDNCAQFYWAVEAADGCIYTVPYGTSFIMRFDPRTDELTKFGHLEHDGTYEYLYWTGVLGPSGRYIFCAPGMALRTLCIDTQELKIELIGPEFGRCDGLWTEQGKWHGGDLGGDNCIYFAPTYGASRLLRVEPVTKTVSLFGPDLRRLSGCPIMPWGILGTGKDGCLYGTPMFADSILRIDPFDSTVSTICKPDMANIPADQRLCKLGSPLCDRDGAIWICPMDLDVRFLRLAPRRPQTTLLTTLLQPKNHIVLQEGLCDLRCYGPALAVALWREAVQTNGDSTLVCRLLQAVAKALPTVVTASIKTPNNGSTACLILRTILAVLPPQENNYYFNPTRNTWDWHQAEAKKRGMCLASVASNDEHVILQKLSKGSDTWLGGCREKSVPISHQRSHATGISRQRPHATDDWEWSDGTPFLFAPWSEVQIFEVSSEAALLDRLCMRENFWHRRCNHEKLAGIYRKPRHAPPLECIQLLVTDHDVLQQCFAASAEIRDMLLRIFDYILSLKKSVPLGQLPTSEAPREPNSRVVQKVITKHLEKEWPDLINAFRVVSCAPPSLCANQRHRISFLANVVAASNILQAPAPNKWEPLPKTANDWSWPPLPIIPLRAACKLVQHLGPDTLLAVWPLLAESIATVLLRMVDAVRTDLVHATDVLATVFERERKASLETYQKQLRRARRDPTYPEFRAAALDLMKQLAALHRKEHRAQTISSFPVLYNRAAVLLPRFNAFLAKLAQKCAVAKSLQAPLKGCGRALEKLVLRPGIAAEFKAKGVEALDATTLVDILRGSLECPDFTEIVFILELLELLDVEMGDPKKAIAQGWDLDKFQIRIIHIKDRFTIPTSGGWADAMVNFSFAHGDDTHHVMELQLQHAQMLVVRKEGKAHDRYNSFRSAVELLETVDQPPQDSFEEKPEDMPPLQRLEQRMQQQIDALTTQNKYLLAEVHQLKAAIMGQTTQQREDSSMADGATGALLSEVYDV